MAKVSIYFLTLSQGISLEETRTFIFLDHILYEKFPGLQQRGKALWGAGIAVVSDNLRLV